MSALSPPVHFDVGECIKKRLAEQTCDRDDDLENRAEDTPPPHPFWLAPAPAAPAAAATLATAGTIPPPNSSTPPPSALPSFAAATAATAATAPPTTPSPPPLSAQAHNKLKSRARRDKKRDEARAASDNPLLKSVHRKRRAEGQATALELNVDAADLPHSKLAWQGSRTAEDGGFELSEPPGPHDLETGLGGVSYTQDEVDALTGTRDLMYISWLGRLTIPLLDSQRRVIAVLGGTPRDAVGWKVVTDGAAALLKERQSRVHLTEEQLHHRRAQDAFPAIARGVAHGGGRMEPGEVANNAANTKLTDELLAHPYFQRLAAFANILFAIWAPLLFAYYQVQMALLDEWKPMRWNFVGSIFAACTFNFGPRAITAPHLDFANLAWGWCAVTALGEFDPDVVGHLILYDLRIVVRFPPGSTVLLPSALVRHGNVPIRAHEHRSSFMQYTAGGLFRWVRNGFKTDAAFKASASYEEKAVKEAEDAGRWEAGMQMFSVIDDM